MRTSAGFRVATALVVAFALSVPRLVPASGEVAPRRAGALRRWLAAAPYRRTWVAEPAAHASAGPHGGRVRTWYDPVLVADLRAGATTFRRKAAMVKELYASEEDAMPVAWSVMRKVARRSGADGRGWLFFEGGTSGGIFGRGLRVCTGCHEDGVDYLLSEFRP